MKQDKKEQSQEEKRRLYYLDLIHKDLELCILPEIEEIYTFIQTKIILKN